MGIFQRIYYLFAPYTDYRERRVGRFFKGLTEHSNQLQTRTRLGELMQHNIAVINLWSEYRYKGYRYLRKSARKQLYINLQLIAEDFDKFHVENHRSEEIVTAHIHTIAPHAHVNHERAVLLQSLMDYFSPSRGVYEYRVSSSFGRLLRNPASETLVGDCNQIVTLYIYLYSRYFDIRDLQVRQLPEHVALHYGGIDIEATNGTFANYDGKDGAKLMPIEEIVSINLLDVTDSYLSKHEVAAEDFLQSSRFAYILSHERDIVTNNLNAAYATLINSLMSRNNYSEALKFAKDSRNIELLAVVGHNGAIHAMSQNNFAAARRFASHSLKKEELIRSSYQAEGAYHYNAGRYRDAITAYEHYGDQALVRQCYEGLFFEQQGKLGPNMTTETIKKYSSVIKKMQTYAKKSGNRGLIEHANSLNKHL
jgi:hypothetical protein